MRIYGIEAQFDLLDREDALEQQAAQLRSDLARGDVDISAWSMFEPDVELVR